VRSDLPRELVKVQPSSLNSAPETPQPRHTNDEMNSPFMPAYGTSLRQKFRCSLTVSVIQLAPAAHFFLALYPYCEVSVDDLTHLNQIIP